MDQKTGKFKEVEEGFTARQAITEAKRCLNCKVPQCVKGCPIENNIPAFIHQISMGNMGNALEIINEKSNLPAICGRVCPHEKQCEGHCVMNKKGMPIRVGKLERFVADFDSSIGLFHEKISAKTRGKVAVIGSGPAGLTVAGDLARMGFNVVIYEKEAELGGVLLYGIPEYRLPKDVVRHEVEKIEALGVTFITNCSIGTDITVDEMFKRGFDAVFIGSGTAVPKTLEIPGKEAKGVLQSSYFLRMVSLYNNQSIGLDEVPVKSGDIVGVIGAGNVAMDAARTAMRLGAKKVSVYYHRTEADMSANQSEYTEAVAEHVNFYWQTNVVEFLSDNGRLTAVKIQNRETGNETTEPVDKMLFAVGSQPANRIVSTTTGIDVNDNGYVITKGRPYGMTTRHGVFAGGDVVHTPQTVVLAMKDAKQVAMGIAQYVDAKKLLED